MRVPIRSLGGKLIVVATATLLLCLLLFALTSWSAVNLYVEYQASRDASAQLTKVATAYQSHTQVLLRSVETLSRDTRLQEVVSLPDTTAKTSLIHRLLDQQAAKQHPLTLTLFDATGRSITHTSTVTTLSEVQPLLAHTLQGQASSDLQTFSGPTSAQIQGQSWAITIAVPVRDQTQHVHGTLLATQSIDSLFVQQLALDSGTPILLCIHNQIIHSSLALLAATGTRANDSVCQIGASNYTAGTQRYQTQAQSVSLPQQIGKTPTLTLVALQPLDGLTSHPRRILLLIAGIGLSIFSLGIILLVYFIRTFLIRPLQRVQTQVQVLLSQNSAIDVGIPQSNELPELAQSYQILTNSLNHESQALLDQMSKILVMSDALMSTLNLEQLLGEFVTRMGHIIQVKHVSLLLYGRESIAPWAVAQWSDASEEVVLRPFSAPQKGVTVYIDPDNDISMAVTTKMSVISNAQSARTTAHQASFQAYHPDGRGSRIPNHALRDVDLALARLTLQRQKIVYGEDIGAIYQQQPESWARLALEKGYCSAIAVPLLLQDQAIGAFILYTEELHPISNKDTFLLSTAALQTSMAIENALLFAEVKDKNDALERANQLKSQFLANVTHELRTPLHSIISYGTLIVEGFVDGTLTDEQEQHIQFMVRRAEDLSHLVNDMLDLSKIEADRIEVKPEPLILRQSLSEVIEQLTPLANTKELYLNLEIDESFPRVAADGHRLRQVVLNLVSNALKFTEQGGVTIHCTQLEQQGMARISVADTGIGISPAAMEYIFEAFRQADGSTTRRFGGTGLGLTIAKKLIELQGGEIAVESVPRKGSTFSFTLPIILA
ncbi:sensor histidine kinase [Dictyobacter arantiisoli]|uniref:histidine kinase n=1 Tax=Dictyobacter arantiisoli TaxID=2014874 RepID=A0A5A5T819_9CHLR|nr:ATP-binding protein [Dictyobacter arantiisoli]GCF07611.1 hypothetical protein KDI_11750 [Dictyobacter arantiisoli]